MASVESPPLMTAPAQGFHGPGVGSAPGPATGLSSQPNNASGYFTQQYLAAPLASGVPQISAPHSPAGASSSHLPARSPYTDSQNFMPSTESPLTAADDETILNTIANSTPHALPLSLPSPHPLSSSVAATGGATPLSGSLPNHQQHQHIDAASEAAASQLGSDSQANAAAMASNYNHSINTAGSGVQGSSSAAAAGASRFMENWDASERGSSVMDGEGSAYGDSASMHLPSRSNTLKKKASLRRTNSLHRSSSRRSMKAGSVRSLALQSHSDSDEMQSAFYCPVPTKGNPSEALVSRFQAWRKILKDLIAYHREIQNSYEQRAKSTQRLSTTLNGVTIQPGFLDTGGIDDAAQMLRSYHKQAISEAVKAREIEEDVILALTGLRSDLSQKIKEIKNISGDFRNNVDKEMEATRRAVKNLQDSLGQAELDSSMTTGRQDPYLLRLIADRQLERQIEEENYLHQAFINLERSGRELESIVVGEIQKSYNAYMGILRREAAATWATVDELRTGPIAMPKDQEWVAFIRSSDQLIDPEVPIRSFQFITYPGQNHYACQEIRAGLLERKSKYLKSYTAGWYVLSPTHLHEFKSADKMQAPVMSLYLPEQKLGSHSTDGASSSKFVLKGRQTGGLHRGHTWVFRAESYDTMMAWYQDLQALTEKSPQEREDFARGQMHTRSASRASQRTFSSDGVVNEDDDEPFSGTSAAAIAGAAAGTKAAEEGLKGMQASPAAHMNDGGAGAPGGGVYVGSGANARALSPEGSQATSQSQQYQPQSSTPTRRPSQGGRFPSDLQVNSQRGLEIQAAGIPISPTSAAGSGSHQGSGQGSDYGVIAAAGALPCSQLPPLAPNGYAYPDQGVPQPTQQRKLQLQPLQPQTQQYFRYPEGFAPANQVIESDLSQAAYHQQQQQQQQQQYYAGQSQQVPVAVPVAPAVDGAVEYASTPLTNGAAVAANGVNGINGAFGASSVSEEPGYVANKPVNSPPELVRGQKSETGTLCSLHIPGEFPGSATETK